MSRAPWVTHFGLTRTPFSKSIAAKDLFVRDGHAEAVARINHCVAESALGVLVGDVGAGKTVAVRAAAAGLDVASHHVVYVPNPGNGGSAVPCARRRLVRRGMGAVIFEAPSPPMSGTTLCSRVDVRSGAGWHHELMNDAVPGDETPSSERLRLSLGWRSLQRAAWEEARACFEAEIAEGDSPEALEGLSWAAWWVNEADVVLDAREQAYRLYRNAADHRGAARMAIWLGSDVLDFRGEPAVAAGWHRRAHRVLEGEDLAPEHGWLAVHEGTIALDLEGDTVTARRLGRECSEVGRTLGVIDLEMLGLALEGQAAVHEGDVATGMQALDEAAAAVAGELEELVSVGWSCCSLIKACEQVRDHDRAAQWSQQTIAFAKKVRFDPWFGICRSFYATVLMWRGMWAEAEAELVAAQERMAATRPPWAAEAVVRLGELRVCQGRLPEAEGLFTQVDFHPRAQLGLAAVALNRRDPATAVALGERALRNLPHTEQTGRVPALELLVRAHVAAGDRASAQSALEELAPLAVGLGTPTLAGVSGL